LNQWREECGNPETGFVFANANGEPRNIDALCRPAARVIERESDTVDEAGAASDIPPMRCRTKVAPIILVAAVGLEPTTYGL